MSKIKEEVGNIYGKLTVLERAEKDSQGKHAFWYCQCTCGNIVIVSGTNLRYGKTKSCGCSNGRLLPPGQAAFNALYSQYKCNAKRNNRVFELTKEDFGFLTKMNCHYCGDEPKQVRSQDGLNGDYTYNGVDRIDNTKGYTMDNVVACCGICNRMKRDMTPIEFIEHIIKIYEREVVL